MVAPSQPQGFVWSGGWRRLLRVSRRCRRGRGLHGFPAAESKIYWAYDRYCMPRTPGKMTPEYPNVFAEFVGDAKDFFKRCEDTFLGGQKPLTIAPLQE